MISFKGIKLGGVGKAEAPKDDADSKGNIFGQSLNVGQMKKSKKEAYIESKNQKKAYVSLGLSLVVLMLYSVFFFYENTVAYIKAPGQIRELNEEITEYEEVIIPELETTRELHKAAYDEEYEEIITALATVFPDEVDKLGIVRLFESFATEVDASFPPFEFTSINLQAPQNRGGHLVIPVSTSIHSSLAGFDKFLTLVEQSGHIYEGGEGDKEIVDPLIRLMSVSSISIKYRGVDPNTGKDGGVDFSVKVNIYTRPTSTQV
ncbi:MAG: hypothetical protein OEY44_03485 [Candidatus Peregrinibacteria bacterium]|nr:hypothetical protein [Candidatus Peregrinibacteria bacterium]